MKFTIDRGTWRTGRYRNQDDRVGVSQLLNDKGFRCCLGFYLGACGLPDAALIEHGEPSSLLKNDQVLVPDWLLVSINGETIDSVECRTLIEINDSVECRTLIEINGKEEAITDQSREDEIYKHFAEVGVEVEFAGEYPDKVRARELR